MHKIVRESSQLGRARWCFNKNSALVVKTKGKYLTHMGYSDDGLRLFPEEAVFLVDRDEIELISTEENEVEKVLSKIEIFGILDSCGIDMKAYTVYAALKEQRFHVFRHGYWEASKQELKNLKPPQVNQESFPLTSSSSTSSPKRIKTFDEESKNNLIISFDVYRPQASFSKNNIGKPDFWLMIFSADGNMPPISYFRNQFESGSKIMIPHLSGSQVDTQN